MIALAVAALLAADDVTFSRAEAGEIAANLDRLAAIESAVPVFGVEPFAYEVDDLGNVTMPETLSVSVAWGPLGATGDAPLVVEARRNVWWNTGLGVMAGGLATADGAQLTYGLDWRLLTFRRWGLLVGAGRRGAHVAAGREVYRRTMLWAGPATDWRGNVGGAAGVRLAF